MISVVISLGLVLTFVTFYEPPVDDNRCRWISKVYLPNHDQIISERSQEYFHYPYSSMGDVIPKARSLFVAFSGYTTVTRIDLMREGITQFFSIPGPNRNTNQTTPAIFDRNISLLLPLEDDIRYGDEVRIRVIFVHGGECTWTGEVRRA